MLFLVIIQPAQDDTWPSCLQRQNQEFSNTFKETVISGFILTVDVSQSRLINAYWTTVFIQTYSICVTFIGFECNSLL